MEVYYGIVGIVLVMGISVILFNGTVRTLTKTTKLLVKALDKNVDGIVTMDRLIVKNTRVNLDNLQKAVALAKADVELSAHELRCLAVTLINIVDVYKSTLDPIIDGESIKTLDSMVDDIRQTLKVQSKEEMEKRFQKFFSTN